MYPYLFDPKSDLKLVSTDFSVLAGNVLELQLNPFQPFGVFITIDYNSFRDYKTFSCSIQLSIKFKLLIYDEIAEIKSTVMFRLRTTVIYPAYKC